MQQQHSMPLMLGGTIGIIGLIAMGASTTVGVLMCLLGLGIALWPKLIQLRSQRQTPQAAIPQQTVIAVPQQKQREMEQFIGKQGSSEKILSLLKRTLYQANLDPRKPVLVGDNNETILSVHEVLDEIVTIAEAHKLPPSELAGAITKVYDRIFENVEAAIAAYPGDLDYLTIWLANRSLKDVRKELEVQSESVQK
jgi:hypothetical protein